MQHLNTLHRRILCGLVALPLALTGCAATSPEPAPPPTSTAADKVTTFLMYYGNAEEAINFYTSLFEDSRIENIDRYGPEGPGTDGSVMHATFTLAGRSFMAIDSAIDHGFTFTPATSLFVTCESEAELDRLFGAISEGGEVFMPPDNYGFSEKFTWVNDRFGVSWQLNWPGASTGN